MNSIPAPLPAVTPLGLHARGVIGSCILHGVLIAALVGGRALWLSDDWDADAKEQVTWVELPRGGGSGLLDLPQESLLPAAGSLAGTAAPDEIPSAPLPEIDAGDSGPRQDERKAGEAKEPAPGARPGSGEVRGDPRGSGKGYGAPGASGGDGGTGPGGGMGLGGGSRKMLFEMADFPYAWYQARLEDKLRAAWRRPQGADRKARVRFVLHRDGTVTEIKLTEPSRDSAFDRSVLEAVEEAAPFPPLPGAFAQDSVGVVYLFETSPS